MKKRFYDFKNLDFSDCREITDDELFRINGGERVENSNEAVAQAEVGDTLIRDDGTEVTITQGDINWAQAHCGSNSDNTTGISDLQTDQIQNVNTSDSITPTSGSYANTSDNYSTSSVQIPKINNTGFSSQNTALGGNQNSVSTTVNFLLANKSTLKSKEQNKSFNLSEAIYRKPSLTQQDSYSQNVQFKYDKYGKIRNIDEFNNPSLAKYNWNKVFLDDKNEYTEKEGIKPEYVKIQDPDKPKGNYLPQLTTKESDEYGRFMKDMEATQDFIVSNHHFSYCVNNEIFGEITYYWLTDKNKEKILTPQFLDTDNNGIIDYVRPF